MEAVDLSTLANNFNESSLEAKHLSLRDRADIVIKYMYAAKRLNCAPDFLDGVDVMRLYRQHIHIRTGGQEPGDEVRKGSLQEFVDQFDLLIDSFKEHGYIKGNEIPFSIQNNLPINGAHRIAVSMALACKIPTIKLDFPGGLWDLNWFIDSGFRQEDINLLLKVIAY